MSEKVASGSIWIRPALEEPRSPRTASAAGVRASTAHAGRAADEELPDGAQESDAYREAALRLLAARGRLAAGKDRLAAAQEFDDAVEALRALAGDGEG